MNIGVDYGSFHETPETHRFIVDERKTTPKRAKSTSVRRPKWSSAGNKPSASGRSDGTASSTSCPTLPQAHRADGGQPAGTSSDSDAFYSEGDMEASGSTTGASSMTDVVHQREPLISTPRTPASMNSARHSAEMDRTSGSVSNGGGSLCPTPSGSGRRSPDMGYMGAGDPVASDKTRRSLVAPDGSGSAFYATKGSDPHARGDFTVVDINSPSDFIRPEIPKDRVKTFISLLFFALGALINMIALSIIHDLVPPRDRGALPDIVLDHIYTNDWALYVSEYLLMVLTYFCILLCFFHEHRWVLFRRCFFLLGLLYLYRSVTMFVTVLPVASPTYVCNPQSNHTTVLLVLKRTGELLLGMGLSVNGYHRYCGDYIYSGHTMILVLGALVVKEYTPKHFWPLHWFTYLWSAAGVFMILFSRGHYTVDVVIAYYITTRLFWIYHTLANVLGPMNLGSHLNLLGRSWWYPLFIYMESNVGGALPHSYEWPIPFAKLWRWVRRRCRRQ